MIRALTCILAWSLCTAALADQSGEKPLPTPVAPADAPKSLRVYPAKVGFTGGRDEQRIIVVAEHAGGRGWDWTREAKYVSADPKVASVDASGVVRPTGDGQTSITVTVNGVTSSVPIQVQNFTRETLVDFSRDVQPILTKASCNSGGCHGAQHGKGGFKLSLFGFDAPFDHAQIVQSAEGRRIVLSDPERSILLAKPALVMEHGGGERLKLGGREYETLKRWLEDGVPEPPAKEATVTGIEVFPPHRIMTPGEKQQIAVTAVWSDGRREDVTRTAQYDALSEGVAAVSPLGLVTAKSAGETHVMIRFCGQATVAQVTLPFAKIEKFPELPKNNFIDEKLIAKWRDLGLTPSPLSSDGEFQRRVFLDVIGTLPTPAEVKAFLAEEPKVGQVSNLTSPNGSSWNLDLQNAVAAKRKKLIEAVLNRPEFVDFWALKWGDLLRINRDALQEKGMWSFHNWVRSELRENRPVDEFVRDIITAEGSTFTDGPANFYRIGRAADDWSETVGQVFLGVRMQCAKCHHHPFEKWTQDDYYGMTAFFTRLGTKNSQEFGLFGQESVIFLRNTGEANHPRKRTVVKPHPLDGPTMDDEFDRRRKLAEWMTTPENPFFARNIVNRFWGYLMGRGLVEPLDDMRATNPASNPELLDALAQDFVKHKFDLKHLLRTILESRAYQLSSVVQPGNEIDAANTHFSRYTTKRLTAEQMADALDYVTGTREKYTGLPLGTRAIQLPDPKVRSYLMDVFGRPARTIVCECERTTQPNIAQALHLLNGEFLNRKIADKSGRIETLLTKKAAEKDIIEEIYLVTLSRAPKPEEFTKAGEWIKQAGDQREGLQDLMWVLVNSREFLFNH